MQRCVSRALRISLRGERVVAAYVLAVPMMIADSFGSTRFVGAVARILALVGGLLTLVVPVTQ